MKFHETSYEEYVHAVDHYNLHPEMKSIYASFPKRLSEFGNLIVYGPPGVGKYTQVLNILRKYSPSDLKYDKRITCQTEKQDLIYRISDIHYEIDMSLLGCNSKMLWHELYFQIVDIVAVKTEKIGIIVCKNFHMIHNELLDIFYSYIQHHNHPQSPLHIKFIILSEHVSFMPKNILDSFQIIAIKRPTKDQYMQNIMHSAISSRNSEHDFVKQIHPRGATMESKMKIQNILRNVDPEYIMNIKELSSFGLIDKIDAIPKDHFNTICNNIIQEMINHEKLSFTQFRDIIYDILVYNLDVPECLWYVISHFIRDGYIDKSCIPSIIDKSYVFLKQYNNNYRPIYHLESIFFYIITLIRRDP